jgi:sec-independent protein translocase protein TatA
MYNQMLIFILYKPILLLSMPGGSEWIMIVVLILLFFGGKKIPELMRGVGKGIKEFNNAKDKVKTEIHESHE